MSILLRLTANDQAGSVYTLIDVAAGPVGQYGPVVLQPVDWGNPAWESTPSGSRGSLGRSYVGPDYKDRTVTFTIRFYGSSKDDLTARIGSFTRVLEAVRRYGGKLTRRAHLQSFRQHLSILDVLPPVFDMPKRGDIGNRADLTVAFTCAPFVHGDPLDVYDTFDTDTASEYTRDAGGAGDLVVTGGVLDAAANLTTESRWIHTDRRYTTPDQQTTIVFTPGVVAGFKAGAIAKRVAATTYLEAWVSDSAGTTTLRIDKVVSGTRTNLTSTTVTGALAVGAWFSVRIRTEGNMVHAAYYYTAETRLGPLGTTVSAMLTSTDVTTFGADAGGYGGFSITPQHTASAITSFEWQPYVYGALSTPGVVRLLDIPGNVDAMVTAHIAQANAGPIDFALLGWTPSTGACNLLDKATVLSSTGLTTDVWGWKTPATTYGTGAATSVTRQYTASAKFGGFYLVATAASGTASSGVSKTTRGKFLRGVPVTFRCWVRSPSSTVTVTATAAAPSAGQTAGTPVTLSTTWQLLTVTHTPTADATEITVVVYRSGGTAADVWWIDGDELYTGATAPSRASQADGRGAPPAFGVIEAENGNTAITSSESDAQSGLVASTTSLLVDANPVGQPGGRALVEVWGRVKLSTTMSGVMAKLAWAPYTPYGGVAYGGWTIEHGRTGRPVQTPGVSAAFRNIRFGTLSIPVDNDDSRVLVTPSFTYATTSTASTTAVTPTSNISPYVGASWTSPANAQTDDNVNSTGPVGGAWMWYGWAPSVPAGAAIIGVEVTVETTPVTTQGAQILQIQRSDWGYLSPDTPGHNVYRTVPAGTTVMTWGGPTDLWGRSWTAAELNDGSFNVQLSNINAATNVDWIKLKVYYTTDVPLIDHLVLVPANQRAVTPTGQAPSDVKWIPQTTSNVEFVKTVSPDLTGRGGPGRNFVEGGGLMVAAGMGGSLLELPAGDVDVVVKLSSSIPDSPQTTFHNDDKERVATVHFAVTPRWLVLRDA